MNTNSPSVWPHPGSRWWKFDFHTHTPASLDTKAWQQAIGTEEEVTPEQWLHKYMQAGIDCVAVTDHNSGAWIDRLKAAYGEMRQQADAGHPPEGFRELSLFPGAEISVNGGFHLLAVFDPSSTTRTITDLLAAVDYHGSDGDCDDVTVAGPVDVVKAVLAAGGIPIPAHADQDKGLLQINPETRKCVLDAQTARQVLTIEHLLAIEWLDPRLSPPGHVKNEAGRMAKVLGSDCHCFQGDAVPGSRYTWIKMATPTVEGLRLALLDGNGVSVRRSDDGDFEPLKTPKHFITEIEIASARFMGNGETEHLHFTPYYNALIGGRGAGKSTIVHALRLAYRRDDELRRLGKETEPYRQFASFTSPVKSRGGGGALRDNTKIRVHLMRDGIIHRLRWSVDGQDTVVEEQDEAGGWQASVSQAVTHNRFPIRVFSQNQIAAMAGESRQALLDVIDEAANVGGLHQSFEESKRTYFSQRARLREMDVQLKVRPELERKLFELNRKLEILAQSHHADVLKAHQQAQRQQREVDTTLEQLQAIPGRIESFAEDLLLDEWSEDAFTPATDQDEVDWKATAERALDETRQELTHIGNALAQSVETLGADRRLAAWRRRALKAQTDYRALQATLAEQGVTDPQEFGRLIQERQQVEMQLKTLAQVAKDRAERKQKAETQWHNIADARKAITGARKSFVESTLANNDFVRMDVVAFGFEERNIERDLRRLLECEDDRFESDILKVEGDEHRAGLAFDLARAPTGDREAALEDVKRRLIGGDKAFKGQFRNYLKKRLNNAEFEEHIRCWFPDDDLKVEYSRRGNGGDWFAIDQGSQGQRSAALLAFLLSFGDEPLILDQPEDDLDNHLIYQLIVQQIRENKRRRQLIIVTHNSNVVVNGDAEMVHAFDFYSGQCRVVERGALQQETVREEVCKVMEGGREAFAQRWARLGRQA